MERKNGEAPLTRWNKPQIKRELDKVLADIPDALGVPQERIDDFKELCSGMNREMQRALLLTVCGVGKWLGGVGDLYYIDIDFVYDTLTDDALYDDFKTEANLHIKAYKLAKKRNYNHYRQPWLQPEPATQAEAYTMIKRGVPDDVVAHMISRADIQAKYPNAFRPVEDAWTERFGF